VDGNNERLLTPGEVASLFRVDPKTVTRWAASGRITSIRTPGGHRGSASLRYARCCEATASQRRKDTRPPDGCPVAEFATILIGCKVSSLSR